MVRLRLIFRRTANTNGVENTIQSNSIRVEMVK